MECGSSGAPEPSSQRKLFRIPFYAAWFTIRSGLIGAPHSPMRHKTEALSEPFEIAQQLVVGPVSPRLASRRVHFVEDGLLQLEVRVQVNLRCFQRLVAEPDGNQRSINSGLEQIHRCVTPHGLRHTAAMEL